jgi:hypothetical protein
MTTLVMSSMEIPPTPHGDSVPSAKQAYRTNYPLTAIHFNENGKGGFVFLPEGAFIRVVATSSLKGCTEVQFEMLTCHIFRADLLSKSTPILNRSGPGAVPQPRE